ncbi:MAG: SpoIVB peptidase [Clostridia bacterium]|nr:SpoIVB peptidase [Clostridia bacterium]
MKIIQWIQKSLCLLMIVIWGFLLFGFFSVPNEIVTVADAVPTHRGMYSMENVKSKKENGETKNFDVTVKFLGTFPVKNTRMKVSARQYVNVSGEVFGLRMYTSGVVIVSTDSVDTPQGNVSPADRAGLKKGDIILQVNGQSVNSHTELSALLSDFHGEAFTIDYQRGEARRSTTFLPAYSASQQKYMAGMWVRDSAAGIGTMTFFDPQSKIFAGLGHAVCDIDTGEKLPLYNGDIVEATITGCYKGATGHAGELCGSFKTESIGTLFSNDVRGVYGKLLTERGNHKMPVATAQEVRPGKAQILSTVDQSGPQLFDVEIEKVSLQDERDRNMVIRVTDPALLQKTGGIVQGMSGSPVIQNHMLVGAVTHVFVNEPQRGYAIFGAYMMETVKNISQAAENLAS